VGLHGGRRTTSTAMIDRREKSHRAENLVSWPYSSEFSATTATHHATMMYQISRREEATDLAWRLPRRRLRSRPSWLVGACLLANLPSKNTLTQHNCVYRRVVTKMADNGRHGAPLPAPAHTTVAQCWLIVVCGGAGSEAPWRPWDNGDRHGRWGTV
jgi:hypothetical protein